MDIFKTYHGEKFWIKLNKTKDGFLVYHLRPEENMVLVNRTTTVEGAESEACRFAENFTGRR